MKNVEIQSPIWLHLEAQPILGFIFFAFGRLGLLELGHRILELFICLRTYPSIHSNFEIKHTTKITGLPGAFYCWNSVSFPQNPPFVLFALKHLVDLLAGLLH